MKNKRKIKILISSVMIFSVITGTVLGCNKWNNNVSTINANKGVGETIEFKFNSSAFDDDSKRITNTGTYSSQYFEKPSTVYNNDLAKLSQCLSLASSSTTESIPNWGKNYDNVIDTTVDDKFIDYSNHRNAYIVEIYKKLGFSDDIYVKYDKTLNDDSNTCAYSIAKKKINVNGKKYTLVCAAPRSGVYGSEWASNFYLTDENDKCSFQLAGEDFYNGIKKYIKDNKLGKNTKIWISGYSRGAGAANIAAALLNQDIAKGMYKFTKDDVYAYMCATPMGTKDKECKSDKYNNIFNIVIESDLVATVAPAVWGFDRYGVVCKIPHLYATPGELKRIEMGKKVNIPKEKVELMKAVSATYNTIRFKNITNNNPEDVTKLFEGFTVGSKINELLDNVALIFGEDIKDYGNQWQNLMIEVVPFVIGQYLKYDSESDTWVEYETLAEYLCDRYGTEIINDAIKAGVFSQTEYMEKIDFANGLCEKNIINKDGLALYRKIIDTYYGIRILAVKNNIDVDVIKDVTERALKRVTDLIVSMSPLMSATKMRSNHFGEFYLAWIKNYNPYTGEVIK